jgi:type I restriction enzyme S subunit
VKTVRLADIATVTSGITKGRRTSEPTEPIPYLAVSNVQAGHLRLDVVKEIDATSAEIDRYALEDGDLVLTEGGDPDKLGRGTIWRSELPRCLHQNHIFRVRTLSRHVLPEYLAAFTSSAQARSYFLRSAKQTTGIASINMTQLKALPVALPSLGEQRRIVAILDQVDAIRVNRRQILTHLDTLTRSTFQEMFGDPASNASRYPTATLRSLSIKFSDGPFGSNLKSSHYTTDGVPVVRLQNIGLGRYLTAERAFVSPEHYSSLSKHDCKPGDVLIATLGDPNLRACLQPEDMPIALNKADCIQFRVDPHKADATWASWLLNMPGTLSMATLLAHGQTRTRIAMGQLRDLEVPVPPLDLQRQFAERAEQINTQRAVVQRALETDDELFASLQSRAFRGEL